MNNINEKDFRKAMKTLVIENPQKLEYFDGVSADDPIPPFVPREETIERKRKDVSRRRRFNAGLIASAAAGSGSAAPVMARAAEQIYEVACACPTPMCVGSTIVLAIVFVVLFVIKRRDKSEQ